MGEAFWGADSSWVEADGRQSGRVGKVERNACEIEVYDILSSPQMGLSVSLVAMFGVLELGEEAHL